MGCYCKIVDKYSRVSNFQSECICKSCKSKKGFISEREYYKDCQIDPEEQTIQFIINCKNEIMKPAFFIIECPNYTVMEV